MGYAEIACCKRCEIPVKTLDKQGFRHLCERCEMILIEDDLIWLDWQTAILHTKAIQQFDRSAELIDHTLDLINEIKRVGKSTNDPNN